MTMTEAGLHPSPGGQEHSIQKAAEIARSMDGPIIEHMPGRTVRALDGIDGVTVQSEHYGGGAANFNDTTVKDALAGITLKESKGAVLRAGETSYQATVEEPGEQVDTTYKASSSAGILTNGKSSSVNIVRKDEQGNEVSNLTSRNPKLAEAINNYAAKKVITRLQ